MQLPPTLAVYLALLSTGCSDFIVTRSSLDEARRLPRAERRNVALRANRTWDGADVFMQAKNLGTATLPAREPSKARVHGIAPSTIGGAVLLVIGGVFLVSSIPVFATPTPPPRTTDFPTCFFVCTNSQLGGILAGIGAVHALLGTILVVTGTSSETVAPGMEGMRYLP